MSDFHSTPLRYYPHFPNENTAGCAKPSHLPKVTQVIIKGALIGDLGQDSLSVALALCVLPEGRCSKPIQGRCSKPIPNLLATFTWMRSGTSYPRCLMWSCNPSTSPGECHTGTAGPHPRNGSQSHHASDSHPRSRRQRTWGPGHRLLLGGRGKGSGHVSKPL